MEYLMSSCVLINKDFKRRPAAPGRIDGIFLLLQSQKSKQHPGRSNQTTSCQTTRACLDKKDLPELNFPRNHPISFLSSLVHLTVMRSITISLTSLRVFFLYLVSDKSLSALRFYVPSISGEEVLFIDAFGDSLAVSHLREHLPSVSHGRFIEIFHGIFLTTRPSEFELRMTSEMRGQATAQMQSQSSPLNMKLFRKLIYNSTVSISLCCSSLRSESCSEIY